MKLTDHFNDFMKDTVDLNETRVSLLDSSIDAIKAAIQNSDWAPHIRGFAAQGSWAHKTIIRPVEGKAFDADLLVYIDPVEGWEAKDYISTLRAIFADHGTYKDKVRRFSHCVTIEYAGERKIDIVPCVFNRAGLGRYEVCNFNDNTFEQSNPKEYTEWLIKQNSWTGGNGLRKVTRLLKYLRDIKTTFTCKSVLLTTILGERISLLDEYNETDFADVPTALKTIVGRLDDWLQANTLMPTVRNPVLPSESFSNSWDADKYENFRSQIHKYREWIDDAYTETDRDESIGKWQRVFGEEFAKSATVAEAANVSKSARQLLATTAYKAAGDLVALFSEYGPRALPSNFRRLPHMKRPQWRQVVHKPFNVRVSAQRYGTRNGQSLGTVIPTDGPLAKNQWLRFEVRTDMNMPLGADFKTYWRVTNTDEEAERARCLRGGFESCNDGAFRWESLSYRGVHMVEAFIVRKRDNMLVSQSEPFYVVIQ